MERALEIKTNKHNISKLELFLDDISEQFTLDSSIYSLLSVVNDKIFELLYQKAKDHSVRLILSLKSENVVCNWRMDKALFNLVHDQNGDHQLDFVQNLVRDWKWDNENYQIKFSIFNPGLHYRLADERRKNLQNYFKGSLVKYIKI
jgi:hypothetical protein